MFSTVKTYTLLLLLSSFVLANPKQEPSPLKKPKQSIQRPEIQEFYTRLEKALIKTCYSQNFEHCEQETLKKAIERNLPQAMHLKSLHYDKQLPAYDKAVLVSMVKDEADIIFANLSWHYFMGFRKFIIVDNGSTDNTNKLIRLFKEVTSASTSVVIINDSRILYTQTSRVNACTKLAQILFPNATWIFPNDADEFITLDQSLEEALSKVPCEVNCLYAPRITYIPTDNYFTHKKDAKFYEKIHIAHKRNPYNCRDNSPYNGKTFIRAHQGLLVIRGSHMASNTSVTVPTYISALECGIHIREFPLRSPEHVLKKIITIGRALKEFDKMYPDLHDKHYADERYERYLSIGNTAGLEEFKTFMTRGGCAFDEPMPLELTLKSILTSPKQQATYTSLLPPPSSIFFEEKKNSGRRFTR